MAPPRSATTTMTTKSSSSSPNSLLANLGMDDDSDCSSLSSAPASPLAPPGFYPSPPPSQDADEPSAARSQDDLPPARKKRRVAPPKERRTQHLDLSPSADLSYAQQQSQIDYLVKTLTRHRKIVVIAGAGISTSAGIPDFRSTDGLFKTLQKKHNLKASGKLLFDAAVYQDETLTASFQDMVRSLSEEAANTSPTAFHHMLARLGQENRLTRLYTQNIDGIETSMPPLATQIPLNVKAPWPRTIQLHGSLDKMVCQKCRHLSDFDRVLFDRPDAPECPECSRNNQFRIETGQRSHGIGKMRPRIVLYNEHNPDEDAITSVMNADIRSRPDALIVVGTSLKIPGVRRLVKSLCSVIRSRRNGVTMWINNEYPVGKEFEDCWDLMVKGDCEEVARLANLKRWDAKDDVFAECNSSEVERVKKEQGEVSVVVTPSKKRPTPTGFLTPSSSYDEALPLPKRGYSNPASRGRSLQDVLQASKTPGPKKAAPKKSAPRGRAKKAEPAKNTKINSFGRVTKAQKAAASDKSSKLDKDDTKPMHPLAPGAARNNGPNVVANSAGKGEATPPRVGQWGRDDTISPGSIPRGMNRLLNEPTA
ncbi:DHS-like NAD/FAD-binding domain-containing protein [Aspergillus sclerotioniger CBS 115572]|uniref:DHS-like NAD/FAD-binding domain-containing protein n=1 Tax=Aspergillus sclerotioniger CBS 115572 TaxID=1450535 RepID=A0A317W950_9EURO|nr:DHS-like NAD/FAD-binding domain-containing protein [Aspergillus sclerotioniger CBS 115572]PWY83136.1 DHS-like NAD/FAD-binding domain-containing protein [Aspergillus sclerotioniger CBS 115572]